MCIRDRSRIQQYKSLLGEISHTLKATTCSDLYVYLYVLHCEVLHLKIDLTSESSIATLTPFISRRGLISHIYTNCGNSFIDTSKQVAQDFIFRFRHYKIWCFEAKYPITFLFLLPRAPRQEELWKHTVKNSKDLLKRVISYQILVIKTFITNTRQIYRLPSAHLLEPES